MTKISKLKLLLINLYQQYLSELEIGHFIVFDWVEFYTHICVLLDSGELKENEYNTLLDFSISHISRMIEDDFKYNEILATSAGLFNNDLTVGETAKINYWKLPLNTTETFKFFTSNRDILAVSGDEITARTTGPAVLTLKLKATVEDITQQVNIT